MAPHFDIVFKTREEPHVVESREWLQPLVRSVHHRRPSSRGGLSG